MPCRMLSIILGLLEDPLRKTCVLRATGRQTRRLSANRSPCSVRALTFSCARLSFLEFLSRLEDRTARINQSVRAVSAVRASRRRISSSPRTEAIITVVATKPNGDSGLIQEGPLRDRRALSSHPYFAI